MTLRNKAPAESTSVSGSCFLVLNARGTGQNNIHTASCACLRTDPVMGLKGENVPC